MYFVNSIVVPAKARAFGEVKKIYINAELISEDQWIQKCSNIFNNNDEKARFTAKLSKRSDNTSFSMFIETITKTNFIEICLFLLPWSWFEPYSDSFFFVLS